ncbi:transglycosylase domain-containing protein [Microlunatus flavus]|uniref:Membrane carboxypeptidase (Penicillin-binding protein) n=1 Tax=Microlunatus flavus TaxID=1036181 RepID=A0A1H9AK48_9ACTN|nr:transglycosylase domain-containing protein [Microlunatus flavus]SEP77152.1 Membrane carboxypeptidase (penicillin-binding protein) [Microlunatus flavus]
MADPASWGPVAKHPAGAPKRGSARWFKRVAGAIAILVALCVVAGAGAVAYGYSTTELPNPNKDFETATTFVYWGDGKSEMGNFAIQNRQPLDFDQMPDSIKQAVVAAENRTFWTDKGVSLRGLARSAWVIARGGSLQGGSTITQQYIKILYLNSEQTISRKYRELFLAYKLSQQKSKEQILQGYLNTIYFGHGAYGIQAASEAYFKVDAKKLTVPQAAVLASVINNPTAFDPDDEDNRPRLLDRYRYVISSMAQTGDITAEQAAKYSRGLPKFPKVKTSERYGGPNGFLLKMVEQELSTAGFSSSDVQGGGLRVTTTFDEDDQKAAIKAAQDTSEQAAKASGEKESGLHAAVASVDVNSGNVLALYGGPDFVENSRNWATTARPTASTFKAYTLAAGLENGFSLRSRFHGSTWYIPGDKTPVRNEYGRSYGPSVDLTYATAESINTAFVDLIRQLPDGKDKTLEIAEKAGAPKTRGWDTAERNIPIGTPEVSPLNTASAYASFANGGVHVAPHVVKEVKDAEGNVLYKADPAKDRVVSGDVADDVTFALSSVVESGTGRTVSALGRPVAAKTGTNGVDLANGDNIVNSSWFVGYTPQISTAVMYVAGKTGSASLDPYRRPGDSTFFGATYPAQTWLDYMQTATDGQDVEKFDPPAYVNSYSQPTYTPAPQPTQTETTAPTSPATPTQEPTQKPSQTPRPTPSESRRPTPGASGSPRR